MTPARRTPIATAAAFDREQAAHEGLLLLLAEQEAVFDAVDSGLLLQDTEGIRLANPAAARLLGVTQEQLLGSREDDPRWRLVRPDGSPWPSETYPARRAWETGVSQREQVMGVYAPDGQLRWLSITAVPFEAADHLRRVVVSLTDVTLARAATAEMVEMAISDPLTGLRNRRGGELAVDALVDGDAVVVLDLDHFKDVNDRRGHDAGDRALISFAQVLQAACRGRDTAARWGGEEFLLLLPGAGAAGARRVCTSLRLAWSQHVRTSDLPSFSAGIAVLGGGRGARASLAAADAALYAAKDAGRDTVRVAPVGGPPQSPSAAGEATWATRLELVLADGASPLMVFQPIVDLQRGVVAGYEALARFPGSEPPDEWFAAAERAGCAAGLEARAVAHALARLGDLPAGCFLAVNVSPHLLSHPRVQDAFASAGHLDRVVVELTEHHPIPDPQALAVALARLRQAGAKVALDDTGAGHAGLASSPGSGRN